MSTITTKDDTDIYYKEFFMRCSAVLFVCSRAVASGLMLVMSAWVVSSPVVGQDIPPAWAYPVNPPDFKPAPDTGIPRRVPDSMATYTLTQIRDLFVAPVWHPADHPPLPGVVGVGRKPEVRACGVCHRADGPGGPENSSLAGLPAAYIVQQISDFKSGARTSSAPQRVPVKLMISLAKEVTDAEVEVAAAYFAALKPKAIIQIVETDTVPKSYVFGWHLAAVTTGEKEPIGQRIIEVPENLEQFESRDSRSRFIAYVPMGSVGKGKSLATTGGNGKTTQCGICHGPDLSGLGPIPGIAGRSPSYLFRQLYDFQHGQRTGPWSPLMAGVVDKMNEEDLISLVAYAASLKP